MTTQDTTAELRARIAQLEEKIKELERREEQGIEKMFRTLVPEDVRVHMRAAQKEQLLAVRSMLDHWIERAERSNETPR